jgi:hypothetical protein
MKLGRIIELLEAVVLTNAMSEDAEVNWACATDLMSEVLYYSKENSILLTGLAKAQVLRTVEIADIDVVAFTQGKEPDLEVIELAKRKNITLLVTPLSLFSASGRLYSEGLRCCPDNR